MNSFFTAKSISQFFHRSYLSALSFEECSQLSSRLMVILKSFVDEKEPRFPILSELKSSHTQQISIDSPSQVSSGSGKSSGLSYSTLLSLLSQFEKEMKEVCIMPTPKEETVSYCYNYECENEEYKNQVSLLVEALPDLLNQLSITHLQKYYKGSYILARCILHYAQLLLERKCYDQAFSFAVMLIQSSLCEDESSFLWKACCLASLFLFPVKQQLTVFETALTDNSGFLYSHYIM